MAFHWEIDTVFFKYLTYIFIKIKNVFIKFVVHFLEQYLYYVNFFSPSYFNYFSD